MPILDGTDIRYLRGVANGEKSDQALSQVARRFVKEYDVGRHIDGRIVFSPEDASRAAAILVKASIPVSLPVEPLTRAETAHHGFQSEKSGSRRPYQGAVLVRALNAGVTAAGQPLSATPGFSHLVDSEIAAQIQCDVVLWVENLETFRRLDRYGWIPRDLGPVLAVYRGDTNLSVAASMALLTGRPRIWLFVDYDPTGVVIASSVAARAPVERIIAPGMDWLETSISRLGRSDLYHAQRASWQAASTAPHPDLQRIWHLIERHQKGLPQEAAEFY